MSQDNDSGKKRGNPWGNTSGNNGDGRKGRDNPCVAPSADQLDSPRPGKRGRKGTGKQDSHKRPCPAKSSLIATIVKAVAAAKLKRKDAGVPRSLQVKAMLQRAKTIHQVGDKNFVVVQFTDG